MIIIIFGIFFYILLKFAKTHVGDIDNLEIVIKTEFGNYECYTDERGYYRICESDKLLSRHLAEFKFKRKLRYWEVIHHVDGNKKNNDLSNLWICDENTHEMIHKYNKRVYGSWNRPQWSNKPVYIK